MISAFTWDMKCHVLISCLINPNGLISYLGFGDLMFGLVVITNRLKANKKYEKEQASNFRAQRF